MTEEQPQESALVIRHLYRLTEVDEPTENDLVFDAPGAEDIASRCAGIVLESGDEMRATTLLAAGVPVVYLGETVLHDSTVIDRLVAAHGGSRIGIYAPTRRMEVTWSLDTVSNADFRTMTPSICEPSWEVLQANGSATGTIAQWWLKALSSRGVENFLVAAEVADDTDLNIMAGLVEEFGDKLWMAPRGNLPLRPLSEWVTYGHCLHLALPSGYRDFEEALLSELAAPEAEISEEA